MQDKYEIKMYVNKELTKEFEFETREDFEKIMAKLLGLQVKKEKREEKD